QGGAQRGQHRRAGEVLAGYQLEAAAHAVELREQYSGDLWILVGQLTEVGAVEGLVHGHGELQSAVSAHVAVGCRNGGLTLWGARRPAKTGTRARSGGSARSRRGPPGSGRRRPRRCAG